MISTTILSDIVSSCALLTFRLADNFGREPDFDATEFDRYQSQRNKASLIRAMLVMLFSMFDELIGWLDQF